MPHNSVLVLFAHPHTAKSRANRVMLREIQNLESVTVKDLYELYPDFNINIRTEQDALENADLIVFHHPFYWYSSPPLLKQWLDDVLEYGFAYGANGNKLHGKKLLLALTTGGPDTAYNRDGYHFFTLDELLRPFEQTARLCGLSFCTPFVLQGVSARTDEEIAAHARNYKNLLEKFVATGEI